ncbi:SDR family NAD(P)-dependent oxidoreductase [bacterium]|nr:SDR family NAD(P)-dependent oxidoreductase [bacterium]
MRNEPKALREQVIVITGASSGIGLATALEAGRRGARVALIARSRHTLQYLSETINKDGGQATAIVCDVTDSHAMARAAQTTVDRFGRIDTWINNAGQGLYGRLDEVPLESSKRLFDVNFWGVVNGSLAALPFLKTSEGTLINLGSEVSDAYPPLLGMYVATKHAVKGFTDALRVEIEQVDKAPVSITLIQPTAVDTPFPQHARNFMNHEPMLPQPRVDPRKVAEAILHAATHRTRSKSVGVMSLLNTAVAKFAPSFGDRRAAALFDKQHYDEPPRHPEGTLEKPSEEIEAAGRIFGTGGKVPERSSKS